jgi:glycosyltransferase involved in cell wall biosynthesis
MFGISVILCTHNPRADYLKRVLDALKAQTLPKEQWELLLIDNASKEPLAGSWDLSWHTNGRHVREENLGLTNARLRGIAEATAPLLVFVDDDNVLDPHYLMSALKIERDCPMLGAWAGNCQAEFESTPPEWVLSRLGYLAIASVRRDAWSNIPNSETVPYGAGLCVRANVAREYERRTANDAVGLSLDRKGSNLSSGGDVDIVFTAFQMGMGAGRFKNLSLIHIIPSFRLQEDYFVRLIESGEHAIHILYDRHGMREERVEKTWRGRLANFFRYWLASRPNRRFMRAQNRGRDRALVELSRMAIDRKNSRIQNKTGAVQTNA